LATREVGLPVVLALGAPGCHGRREVFGAGLPLGGGEFGFD
jgi:hypothetical protein